MPAYGFKARWREPLIHGTKRTTIRAERKDGRAPRVGDAFYAYFGMRTKQCELLFTSTTVAVKPVAMRLEQGESEFDFGFCLVVEGQLLGMRAANKVARLDGFKDAHELFAFFHEEHDLTTTFHGHLIEWQQPPTFPEQKKRPGRATKVPSAILLAWETRMEATGALLRAIKTTYPLHSMVEVTIGGATIVAKVEAYAGIWDNDPTQIYVRNVKTGRLRNFSASAEYFAAKPVGPDDDHPDDPPF